jgi:hypothetical protein
MPFSSLAGSPTRKCTGLRRVNCIEVKTCTNCGQAKPLSDYYRQSSQKSGLNPRCKPCVSAANKQWAIEHADRDRELKRNRARRIKSLTSRVVDPARRRADHYRRTYGLTADEAARFEARLYGPCDICGDIESMVHGSAGPHLSVDHDHKTGKVRGLLCFACNRAIGCGRDDPARLRKMAAYLENPPHAYGGTPVKYRSFIKGLPISAPPRPKAGWSQSEETKAKIAASAVGNKRGIGAIHVRGPEWRERNAEAQRQAWARRKAAAT